MEALGLLYLLTKFPTLTPSGEREKEATISLNQKHKSRCVGTWTSVSRPLETVLGRKYHVDFESAITNTKFHQPDGKT